MFSCSPPIGGATKLNFLKCIFSEMFSVKWPCNYH